jgi:hypothetical protein
MKINNNKIKFNTEIPIQKDFYPEPAIKNLPEWYKKTDSFINSNTFKVHNGRGNQTIKKCMPVFDAITAGYILKTHVDVYVSLTEQNFSYYNWPSYDPISFHPIEQAPLHPKTNKMEYPKWNNPWSIITPSGYSCLFIPPMHNPNNIFTIMPGVVDTDEYVKPVNFPFTLDNPLFEGIIPAGTAICQVIPFKRDSFKMEIGEKKDKERINFFSSVYNNKWVNNYKSRFWNKKEYK